MCQVKRLTCYTDDLLAAQVEERARLEGRTVSRMMALLLEAGLTGKVSRPGETGSRAIPPGDRLPVKSTTERESG